MEYTVHLVSDQFGMDRFLVAKKRPSKNGISYSVEWLEENECEEVCRLLNDKTNVAQPEAVLPLLDAVPTTVDLRGAYTQGFLDCERELSRRGIEDRRWDGDLSITKRLFEAWAKKEGIAF